MENLKLPTWNEVLKRDYDSWDKEHIIIDTAHKDIDCCISELLNKLNLNNKNIISG